MKAKADNPLNAVLALKITVAVSDYAAAVCLAKCKTTKQAVQLFEVVFNPLATACVTAGSNPPTKEDLKNLITAHARKALELLD